MQARREGKTEELQAPVSTHVPFGPVGMTQDQANAVPYPDSDKASCVARAELVVDVGLTGPP